MKKTPANTAFQATRPQMTEGAVTFLDILGWKGIWQREENPAEKLLNLITLIETRTSQLQNELAELNDIYRGFNTEIKSISDTIALFTPGAPTPAIYLHGKIIAFAIIESIKNKIPIRGATAYGHFENKKNIMIGPAVDEAAEWHEATDWIGVVQTPSAEFRYKSKFHDIWEKYDIKFKQIGKFNSYSVNWTKEWKDNHGGMSSLLDVFGEMGPILPSISPKYKNTLEYYDLKSSKRIFNKHNKRKIRHFSQ